MAVVGTGRYGSGGFYAVVGRRASLVTMFHRSGLRFCLGGLGVRIVCVGNIHIGALGGWFRLLLIAGLSLYQLGFLVGRLVWALWLFSFSFGGVGGGLLISRFETRNQFSFQTGLSKATPLKLGLELDDLEVGPVRHGV